MDEKVSKAVEVEQVEEVLWHEQVAVCQKYDSKVADDGQHKKTHSNFDRFPVTCDGGCVSKKS